MDVAGPRRWWHCQPETLRPMVTGRWDDLGKFKVPVLRGLAARPPYFHDGSARTLEDVVQFYVERFDIHTSSRQNADLAAFLRAL